MQPTAAAQSRTPRLMSDVGPTERNMPLPLDLAEGDKFAILAITNVGTEALGCQVLPDSTAVAPGLPVDIIDEFWQRSLGTIAIEALRRCNLLLLRRAPSETP